MSDSYSLYSNFTLSSDRTDNNKKAFTVGQRKSVSDQLKVYTEHQFTHESIQSGVGHTFGLDYQINKELIANFSVQTARLDKVESGLTDRDAFSVGLSYKEDATDASIVRIRSTDDATGNPCPATSADTDSPGATSAAVIAVGGIHGQ